MRHRLWTGLALLVLGSMLTASTFAEGDDDRRERRRRARRERPKVGQQLKDFELKDVKGKSVKLSDFRGKKFFALELGACT